MGQGDNWGTTANRTSYTAWFIVITFAVFAGNLASFGVQKYVEYWEIQQFTKAAHVAAEEMRAKVEAGRKAQEAQHAEREAQAIVRQQQNSQQQAAQRQAQETCNYWQREVAKENSSRNRTYRDSTCDLAKKLRY